MNRAFGMIKFKRGTGAALVAGYFVMTTWWSAFVDLASISIVAQN